MSSNVRLYKRETRFRRQITVSLFKSRALKRGGDTLNALSEIIVNALRDRAAGRLDGRGAVDGLRARKYRLRVHVRLVCTARTRATPAVDTIFVTRVRCRRPFGKFHRTVLVRRFPAGFERARFYLPSPPPVRKAVARRRGDREIRPERLSKVIGERSVYKNEPNRTVTFRNFLHEHVYDNVRPFTVIFVTSPLCGTNRFLFFDSPVFASRDRRTRLINERRKRVTFASRWLPRGFLRKRRCTKMEPGRQMATSELTKNCFRLD